MRSNRTLVSLSITVLSLAGVSCSSNSSQALARHPEYPRLRKEMVEVVQVIRTASGMDLYRALNKLVAYDVFAVETTCDLLQDPNPRVRSNAVWVLGQIPADEAFPGEEKRLISALEKSLKDPDRLVRFESASALVLRNQWSRIPMLFEGLKDEDAAVRMSCQDTLRTATSMDFGYRPDDSSELRARAIERWQTWYLDWQRMSG